MKITNLRQDSANSMLVEIDGQKFRIHGEAEISMHEAKKSIPGCLKNVETIAEIRDLLGYYNRKLAAVDSPKPAGHSPGPFTIDGIQNNSRATTSIIIRSAGGNASHGRAPYVAEISWPREGLKRAESAITDEDWANAYLIASAADLLAALERILAAPMVNYDDMEDEDEAAVEQARAAIARAKGE